MFSARSAVISCIPSPLHLVFLCGESTMLRLFLCCAMLGCGVLTTQTNVPLTAEQIMQRVGANQDRSEKLRRTYVYRQHVRVSSHKSNGKLMRDEVADYVVVPNAGASTKKLTA